MPYLSKIRINPLRREGQRLIANPRAMKAAILGGLPFEWVEERVLWRRELAAHVCNVLVLTDTRPSWDHLVERAGWPGADGGGALVRDYAPLLDQILLGREFAFRLHANPTSTSRAPERPTRSQREHLADGSPQRGVRLGHRTTARQLSWFLDRATDDNSTWGFTVGPRAEPRVQITARRREEFGKAGGQRVMLDTATFEGVLAVTDAERLREVLLTGIGRAKAYGCGLLTLAPSGVIDVVAR